MKVLILGSNGFIGKNLKEYLQSFAEYELLCPTRNELDLLDEDIVRQYLKTNTPDVVVDAAVCRNPIYFQNLNSATELEQDIRMFYILEKYRCYYGKLLYFGSGAEFDKSKDIINVKEDDFMHNIPSTQYGLAKYVIGRCIDRSSSLYNLRIFGLFGKYENWKTTFISGCCCKALKKVPITIRQNVFFDYMYIDDFCTIVRWFIDHTPAFHTYNVTTGQKIDLVTIASMVKLVAQVDIPVYVCKSGLANEYTANNHRLIKEVGNIPFTDMKQAIAALLHYYQGMVEQIDLMSLLYQ